MILLTVIELLVMFCLPAGIIRLTKKVKFFNTIGAIALCYLVGFIFAILPVNYDKSLSETVASVIVAIAIPLILFSFNLKSVKNLAKNVSIGYGLMIISVAVISSISAIVASSLSLENSAKLAGMATGLYTGGTPNLIAIGNALLSGEEKNVVISAATTADFFVGGVYFLLILTVVKPIYRKFLPEKPTYSPTSSQNDNNEAEIENAQKEYDYSSIPRDKKSILKLVGVLLLAIACLGIGAGIEILVNGNMNGSLYIMVAVSVLGILVSFIRPVREVKGTYQIGQYLILVFSLGLAMSINIKALVGEILPTLFFFAVVQTLSALVHLLLCKIFKIDGGSALITSVAGIYGPPFIAPVANAYGDKSLIAPGVICGVVGLVVGNLLGIGLGSLLNLII